jgi:hypothetical protein
VEELGPLFIHPHRPDGFWILILVVSLPTIAACLLVLWRGQLPDALTSSFLLLLPLVTYVLGNMNLADASQQVEFCGSCHESMSPLLESLQSDDVTLAGLHCQRGAVSHKTACYSCHSGYGLSGDMTAKFAGLRHMIHTATGSAVFPLSLNRPFDIDACLACHAEAAPFRAVEAHRDPGLQEALVGRDMGCTGACHVTAHPADALNGAAAWAGEQ